MNSSRQERMETLGEAAARLLAGLKERAKRPAGEKPAEIAESRDVSGAAGRESANREAARHPGPQLPVGQTGEIVAEDSEGTKPSAYTSVGGIVGRGSVTYANDNEHHADSRKSLETSRSTSARLDPLTVPSFG